MIVWNCQKVNSMKHLPRIPNRSPPPIIIRMELFSQVGEDKLTERTCTAAQEKQIDRASFSVLIYTLYILEIYLFGLKI